jgi:hypothetical protein
VSTSQPYRRIHTDRYHNARKKELLFGAMVESSVPEDNILRGIADVHPDKVRQDELVEAL